MKSYFYLKRFSFWLYFGLHHVWKQKSAKCLNMFLTFVCLLFSPCKFFLLFIFELKQYPDKKEEPWNLRALHNQCSLYFKLKIIHHYARKSQHRKNNFGLSPNIVKDSITLMNWFYCLAYNRKKGNGGNLEKMVTWLHGCHSNHS